MLLNSRVARTQIKRVPLTPHELAEADRLLAIFKDRKVSMKITQEELAGLMGFSTQGAISQYLNGKVRLGNEALFRFAYHLNFDPAEVRPDIFDQMPVPEVPSGDLDAESLRFARRFSKLSGGDRIFLQDMAKKLDR